MRQHDVVVAHGSSTLVACAVAGVGLPVPVVYRNISDPAYWTSTPARRWRVRLLLRRMSRVVSLYADGATYVVERLGAAPDRVCTIPNAVTGTGYRPPTRDERRTARLDLGLPLDVPVLLYVAALQPEKHPTTAVEALALLPATTVLVVVGEGPLRGEVEAAAARLAPGRVRLTGRLDDLRAWYRASDVMVLPSEGEGLPAVLIEAGLCGLPSVASTSGGNADIVLDGRSGRVVPPADARALARGVEDALRHRREWGRAAEEHCREAFDLDRVAARWADVLEAAR